MSSFKLNIELKNGLYEAALSGISESIITAIAGAMKKEPNLLVIFTNALFCAMTKPDKIMLKTIAEEVVVLIDSEMTYFNGKPNDLIVVLGVSFALNPLIGDLFAAAIEANLHDSTEQCNCANCQLKRADIKLEEEQEGINKIVEEFQEKKKPSD